MKTHKIYYYGQVTASHLTQTTVNFMLKAADLILMKLHSHCVFVLTCTLVFLGFKKDKYNVFIS